MGSVYAGLLAEAGHEVWAVDTNADHMAAIRSGGLRVEGASGDRTVALAGAVGSPAEIGEVMDVVILATKVGHVREAAEGLAPILGPNTPVISIQNGLGGPQRAAEVLGEDRVVIGVVGGFGASITAPGHAHHNGMQLVRLGEYAGAGISERVNTLIDLWESGGFTVAGYDDVHQLVWEKLICNVAFSGPCTVAEMAVGELLADEHASAVSAQCATEAFEIAKARGVHLGFDDPVAYTREFGSKMPDAIPSMLQDYQAGRRCEIDAINGAIVETATELGRAAPANTVVTSLVRVKEKAAGLG